MQREKNLSLFIAPLKIRKPIVEREIVKHHVVSMEEVGEDPVSQISDQIAAMEMFDSSRPKFQNYLRASYPFQPSSAPSPSTITLPLNAGDIVLVHSIHTNGWADGTLLATGARGWLPTNYCKAYDYAAMRPLLRALTEFWDIVRSGSDSNLGLFQNQDYMRGIVAGVRYLLEKSDCLTRDSPFVRNHDNVRRTRKSLLADLSMLVKAAKALQHMISQPTTHDALDDALDSILLKAFRIVTRAVRFFDVWSEATASARNTPDPERDGSENLRQHAVPAWDNPASPASSRRTGSTSRYSTFSAAIDALHQPPALPTGQDSSGSPIRAQRNSQTKRTSVTHRMSYTSRAAPSKVSNLASDILNQSYDAFLGVLASFLGSHMQSRSSSELLLTTQQAVKSCRQLLGVVEKVIENDFSSSESLLATKDAMYDSITELVHAARLVFQPIHSAEEELPYLPERSQRLVQAATTCVSIAGRCVAKTKAILEDVGDFEMEEDNTSSEPRLSALNSPIRGPYDVINAHDLQQIPEVSSPAPSSTNEHPQFRPRLVISQEMLTPSLSSTHGDSPSTFNGSIPPTPDNNQEDDIPDSTSEVTLQAATKTWTLPEDYSVPVPHLKRHSTVIHNVGLRTSSNGTSDSTGRSSDAIDSSIASTRATSADDNYHLPEKSSQESLLQDGSQKDVDDTEAEILDKTYAHELMFNREGQVIGGTLNALVERLTAHDSTPDALFISTIYLTFRLYAKPKDFVDALVYRFRYAGESVRLAGPVRLRVYNVFKGWLESHWRHDCDDAALPSVVAFARDPLMPVLPNAGKRLLELAEIVASTQRPAVPRVLSAMGKTNTSTARYISPDTPLPPPIISKSQLTALEKWRMGGNGVGLLDFDALELARQITLKTSRIYCSILPEELLATEWTKKTSSLAVNVRALSTLSTDLSNLVADSILQLEEPKKRALVIKQWVKIAAKCEDLNNYDTIWAIVCSLESTNIKRMKKTWELVPQKTKSLFDDLKRYLDYSKNYSVLRQQIQSQMPPCLPFIGVYLTDLTMIDHGNTGTRQLNVENKTISVINLDKHMKTARIISDLQRFQIPYRFAEVSELQTWMQDQLIRVRSAGEKAYQNQYRRSLILEPKEQSRASPVPSSVKDKDKEKFDFLAWTHMISKEKQLPISSQFA